MVKNKYVWLYYRLKSMSIPEVLFRVKQYAQKKVDKKKVGFKHSFVISSLPNSILNFNSQLATTFLYSTQWEVFNKKIDLSEPIDWHLDISSGKRFPDTYSKEIDIRTDRFGSAKYVWEVNRLQFLPTLAIQYVYTKEEKYLLQFMSIIRSWVQENPYLNGVNWYSNIEVNIRIINWFICWNILDASSLARTDLSFCEFIQESWLPTIYQHCLFSYRNPSYYSSANNHLVSEYAGLFVASTFWKFSESEHWNNYSRKGIEKEIRLQHSKKGVNREEAAEYIQFITDLFLIPFVVAQQAHHPFSDEYKNCLGSIINYINDLLDISGNFPQYGDEDDGRILCLFDNLPYNNFTSLLTSGSVIYQNSLFKQRSREFDIKNYILFGDSGKNIYDAIPVTNNFLGSSFYSEEGHFIFRKQSIDKSEIYLHFDAAPLGFLSIAAHGHADALSFIMHLDGQPLFVDSGTYTYHTEPSWRNYFVSTRAHNTLCIDGQNQAFQAGALLWMNHFTPKLHLVQQKTDKEIVVASHNGYDKIGCSHQRSIEFDRLIDTFTIIDSVYSTRDEKHLIEVFFHLHPDATVLHTDANFLVISHENTSRQVQLTIDPSLTVEVVRGQIEPTILGWYSERFYRKREATTIRASKSIFSIENVELNHQITVKS